MSKTKAQILSDKLKEMKGEKAPVVIKVENQKINKVKEIKNGDGRKNNVGIVGKVGRPPGGIALQRRVLKQMMAEHVADDVEISFLDKKSGKTLIVKKPRLIAALEKLFNIGIGGLGNESALDKWLNRAVGKAPQPVIGDEEEDPIRVDLGMDRLLDKAYGEE